MLVDTLTREQPNVHLHYIPSYSSWLNQVELCFAKVERDVIARGVFNSEVRRQKSEVSGRVPISISDV